MVCRICSDERSKEINKALLNGQTVKQVAAKFGLNLWTARNHRKKCLPWRSPRLLKGESVEEQMDELKRELWRLQLLAEAGENVSAALAVVRQRQSLLELEARAAGMLDATHRKLIVQNRPIDGDYKVVFENGRPRTVPA